MKVAFHTLGCKVNQYDTQTLRELFAARGILPASDGEIPDVAVVNSCTVTAESDRKTRQTVRRLRRLYPDAVIAVTGCMAQARPEKAETLAAADIVIGNALNAKLPELVLDFIQHKNRITLIAPHEQGEKISPLCSESFEGKTRAFVKIEDGCNRFCSYCIIPYARGRVRSRAPEKIAAELAALSLSGYKEAVLAGINLSAYGSDCGLNLCDAVEAAEKVPGIERLRLGSLEPDQLTSEIIDRLSECRKLCGQFHLSLQSGSDPVLRRMNRRYDTAFYRKLVNLLREKFDNCSITTDIMVGFPGETDQEFAETLDFVREIGFAKVHAFSYSRREGTPAAKMENQVPEKVKEERSRALIAASDKAAKRFFDSQIGRTEKVLFERPLGNGYFEGYTENYIPVKAKSEHDLQGAILSTTIVAAESGFCIGRTDNTK